MDWLLISLLLILVGIAAGYLAGLFGIGGGLVLVPFFLFLFSHFHISHENVMHYSAGTSLILLVPSSLVAIRRHYFHGNIDFVQAKQWLLIVFIGSLFGILLIKFISTLLLKIIFALYLYVTLIHTLTKLEWQETEKKTSVPPPLLKLIGGFLIGWISVLLGVGGGAFTGPFFRFFNYPLRRAISLSALTSIVVGSVGSLGMMMAGLHEKNALPYSLGYVNFVAALCVLPFMLWTSPKGAKLALELNRKKLQWLYLSFIFTMTIYMTFQIIK